MSSNALFDNLPSGSSFLDHRLIIIDVLLAADPAGIDAYLIIDFQFPINKRESLLSDHTIWVLWDQPSPVREVAE